LKTPKILLYRPKVCIHFEQTMQNMETRAKVRISPILNEAEGTQYVAEVMRTWAEKLNATDTLIIILRQSKFKLSFVPP
jgi:hypothetical protein